MNQYVVDSDEQTSAFEAYSLTYAGADLAGHDTPDGDVPGRWWTHYFNSNADMRDYAAARGVPASAGSTTLVLEDGVLTATTEADGVPVIRTTATVGDGIAVRRAGPAALRDRGERRADQRPLPVPRAARASGWEVTSLEFLEPDHPVSALRPGRPPRGDLGLLLALGVLLLPRRRGAARDAALADDGAHARRPAARGDPPRRRGGGGRVRLDRVQRPTPTPSASRLHARAGAGRGARAALSGATSRRPLPGERAHRDDRPGRPRGGRGAARRPGGRARRARAADRLRPGRLLAGALGPVVRRDGGRRVLFRISAGADRRVPAIVVDGPADEGVTPVTADVRGAAAALAAHLSDLGHRRLAVLAWPGAEERLAGVRDGWRGRAAAAGLPVGGPAVRRRDRGAGVGWAGAGAGETLAQAALAATPRPTAVLGLSDGLALSALSAAHWMGLAVPGDVSVAGLDDLPGSEAAGLTSALVPTGRSGSGRATCSRPCSPGATRRRPPCCRPCSASAARRGRRPPRRPDRR